MKPFFKIEFNRLLKSYSFWLTLLIGLSLSISQYFTQTLQVNQYLDLYKKTGLSMVMPHSVFYYWIGGEASSFEHFVFFMILPLIATIPYGASYLSDKKSGLVKNYFIRGDKKKYLVSKYIVAFLVGGFVVILPLIINFTLTISSLPSIIPDHATGMYSISTTSMWSVLFYTKPFVYVLSYLIIIFIFSGLICVFSMSLGVLLESSFTVLILPFIIWLFLYTVLNMESVRNLIPFYFLDPNQMTENINLWTITIEGLILLIFSLICMKKAIKDETI